MRRALPSSRRSCSIASEIMSKTRLIEAVKTARSQRDETHPRGEAGAGEGLERSGPKPAAHRLQRRLQGHRQAAIRRGEDGDVPPRSRLRHRTRRRRRTGSVQADLVCHCEGPQHGRRQAAARSRRDSQHGLYAAGWWEDIDILNMLIDAGADKEAGRRHHAVSRVLGLEAIQGREGARAQRGATSTSRTSAAGPRCTSASRRNSIRRC